MANIDRPMDDVQALLSCPHANPKAHQKHKFPERYAAQWLLKGLWQSLIVRLLRLTASVSSASAAPTAQTEEPLDAISPGVDLSQEKSL
jgi:hypothetical protein